MLRGLIREGEPYDYEALEQEIVGRAKNLILQIPNAGAVVLECTQLPVLAMAIRDAV